MLDVREEVGKLLAELQAKALTVDDVRASVELATIIRQSHIPEVEPMLIPAMARATLLGAYIQYDIRHQ